MSHCGWGGPEHPLMLGQTCRVCHLPASQVEKGKDLEEQFDALRREHTETLQGACWDSRASRSPPPRSPHRCQRPSGFTWGRGDAAPLLHGTGGLRWYSLPQCPHASDTRLMSPLQSSREHMSRRRCCWQSPTTGPRQPYRYLRRNPWGGGACGGLEDHLLFSHGSPSFLVATSIPDVPGDLAGSSSPGVIRVAVAQQCPCSGRDTSHPASSPAALGDDPGAEFPVEVLPGEDEAGGGVALEHRLQEAHPGAGKGVREGTCLWGAGPKPGVLL